MFFKKYMCEKQAFLHILKRFSKIRSFSKSVSKEIPNKVVSKSKTGVHPPSWTFCRGRVDFGRKKMALQEPKSGYHSIAAFTTLDQCDILS